MVRPKIAVPVLLVAAGVACWPLGAALAHEDRTEPAYEHHIGNHIEGHIAFLKTELKITPEQEPLWSNVAAAMRADVNEYERTLPANAPARPTAIQHLQERTVYTALRARCEQRFLDAFKPLYEKLSEAQRHTADDLLGQGNEDP